MRALLNWSVLMVAVGCETAGNEGEGAAASSTLPEASVEAPPASSSAPVPALLPSTVAPSAGTATATPSGGGGTDSEATAPPSAAAGAANIPAQPGGAGGEVTTAGEGGVFTAPEETATSAGQGGVPAGSGGARGGEAGMNAAGAPSGGAQATGGAPNPDVMECDPAVSAANAALVGQALDELFSDKDLSAIDRYWAEPYLQHNPIADSGVETFRSVMSSFVTSPSFSYERLRTVGECDRVVVQGRYAGTGVIFDMFRVADEHIVEHWDSDSGQASDTAGTDEVQAAAPSAENRALVLDFIEQALIGGDVTAVDEFFAADHLEHRGGGTGPEAFASFVTDENIQYSMVHHVIAQGDFVFLLSEGSLDGAGYGFYDLFRVDQGRIVEHWDSRRVVPNSSASGLGIF